MALDHSRLGLENKSGRFFCVRQVYFTKSCQQVWGRVNQQQQQILLKIGKSLITLLSHPQIAYELIEAGGAEDILQNKIYI